MKPENSNRRRSKVRPQCKTGTDSPYKRGQIGEQVSLDRDSVKISYAFTVELFAGPPNTEKARLVPRLIARPAMGFNHQRVVMALGRALLDSPEHTRAYDSPVIFF